MLRNKVLFSSVLLSAVLGSTSVFGADSVWIDINDHAHADQSITVGNAGSHAGTASAAVGVDANADNNSASFGANANAAVDSVAVGHSADAHFSGSVAVGKGSGVAGADGIAVGHASCSASRGTSIGSYSASGNGSVAVGVNAQADIENGVAIGVDSSVTAKGGMAIGVNAQAKAKNSVAIGIGSVADELNTVSVGSKNNKRRITNVADGINPTDAVNVRQLNGVRDEARAGIASALALAPAALPEPGKTSLNLGVASFKGEGATSINVNHRFIHCNSDLTLGFGVSANTERDVAVRANLGIVF